MSLESTVARLEAVATRLEKVAAGGGGGGGSAGNASGGDELSASVEAFDEFMSTSFKTFQEKSSALGGEVAQIADITAAAFTAQRNFLVIVSKSKKPDAGTFQGLLGDMSSKIGEIGTFKEKNFRSKQTNHLTGVAEGIPALGWVTMEPKPCPYIKEIIGAAQFYTNRVLKEFNNTDGGKPHVEWARSWVTCLNDLQAYVKEHHTTGPAWNPRGGEAKAAASSAPPPPPAPSSESLMQDAPAKSSAPAAKGALFAELNKGGAVTGGLKHVDKSQMTHKNPELRGKSAVPAKAKAAPAKKWGAGGSSDVNKPPVLALNGKKWACEYQKGNKNIVIETEGVNQTLYVFKCTDSVIQVKGKINAITLDGCKKTAIVFDTCVAAFELINCQSVQCQVTGKVETISIDKTDGAQVYLSAESIGASIVTAKSSEMNISVPNPDDPEGDMIELPVPEQFQTKWDPKTKKLVTGPTDIAG